MLCTAWRIANMQERANSCQTLQAARFAAFFSASQGRFGTGMPGYSMRDVTMLGSMIYDGINDAFSHQHSGWHPKVP
jgi:hypothetical protein